MSECTHDCSTCSANCSSRQDKPESLIEKPLETTNIKKVIGIVSGKGGVGKSLVTSLIAVEMQRRNHSTAILDADITGPSIPKAFGVHQRAGADDMGIFPAISKMGTKIMSINMMLENETDPVVWRGPVIAGVVKQFWTDVIWNDVDYMFVDMPPGTGDVPLTVFQSLPIDGIVVVTSPQELVEMVVEKAVKMAKLMNIPILSIVENMAYFDCSDCGKRHYIYGNSNIHQLADRLGIDTVDQIPINPQIAKNCDMGVIELHEEDLLSNTVDKLEKMM